MTDYMILRWAGEDLPAFVDVGVEVGILRRGGAMCLIMSLDDEDEFFTYCRLHGIILQYNYVDIVQKYPLTIEVGLCITIGRRHDDPTWEREDH